MKNRAIIWGNLIFGISTYCIEVIFWDGFFRGYLDIDLSGLILLPVAVTAAIIIFVFYNLFFSQKYKALMWLYLVLIAALCVPLVQFGGQYGELLSRASVYIPSFFASPSVATLYFACSSVLPIAHIISLASGAFVTICIKRKEYPHD